MKYYQEHSQSEMIYRTDGIVVECAGANDLDFFTSAYTVEIFSLAVACGNFVECEPPKKRKSFIHSRDFWYNTVTIIILLILCVGFIFV